MQQTEIKKRNQTMVALFLSIIIPLLFFEAILRVIQPTVDSDNEFILYEYDETLGWKNTPGANGSLKIPDSTTNVNINSKGLRDIEHDYAKGPEKRIEFYGDSFTWGFGVEMQDSYVNIVRQVLEKEKPLEFEVINMAVTGYGTDQQYLTLKKEGLRYGPDIVVFSYHNDVKDVGLKTAYSYPKPFFQLSNGTLELTNVPVPKRNVSWSERPSEDKSLLRSIDDLASVSRVYAFFKNGIRSLIGKQDGKNFDYQTLSVVEKLILESNKLAKENNATFVLVLIPDKEQVYGNVNTIEIDRLTGFAAKNSIKVINLLPELKELGKSNKRLYFNIDRHFSIEGNKIVGGIIAKNLPE